MDKPVIETEISGMKRLNNSRNGNPVWEISTPAGTWRTKEDISDTYKLGGSSEGKKARITLENNRIQYIDVWTKFPDGSEEWY